MCRIKGRHETENDSVQNNIFLIWENIYQSERLYNRSSRNAKLGHGKLLV
jgi:hypothetical protein